MHNHLSRVPPTGLSRANIPSNQLKLPKDLPVRQPPQMPYVLSVINQKHRPQRRQGMVVTSPSPCKEANDMALQSEPVLELVRELTREPEISQEEAELIVYMEIRHYFVLDKVTKIQDSIKRITHRIKVDRMKHSQLFGQ